jgi:hypothetical protein
MAIYKNAGFLQQSEDIAFGQLHRPGSEAPYSGVYKCAGCGREAVSTAGKSLPPQNHHQHTIPQGQIRWRLIVASSHV